MKGVARVVVGYSGGRQLDPTYRKIKDHTEAVLIEFDPDVVSYEDLLVDWARQSSPYRQSSNQYRSAIFYVSEEQKEVALDTVKSLKAGAQGKKVYVDVERATKFYQAEEYHQNFMTKRGQGRGL